MKAKRLPGWKPAFTLAILLFPSVAIAQVQGTCCGKTVTLSKTGVGLDRCFKCKDVMQGQPWPPEDAESVGYMLRCGARYEGTTEGDIRESIRAQLREMGVTSCPDLGCDDATRQKCEKRKKQIDAIKKVLEGKEFMKQWYEKALQESLGNTFEQVQKRIMDEGSNDPRFSGENRLTEAGGIEMDYECPTAESPLKDCELVAAPNCRRSDFDVLNRMCKEHEEGHIVDLKDAWSRFKRGQWSEDKFNKYIEGTSTTKADIDRRIRDELKQYNNDIRILKDWLAKEEKAYQEECAACQGDGTSPEPCG